MLDGRRTVLLTFRFLSARANSSAFQVAFIAPREVSRLRADNNFYNRHRTRVRLSSRGAMKATLVAANARAVSSRPHPTKRLFDSLRNRL